MVLKLETLSFMILVLLTGSTPKGKREQGREKGTRLWRSCTSIPNRVDGNTDLSGSGIIILDPTAAFTP